jgi:hypothetical protein
MDGEGRIAPEISDQEHKKQALMIVKLMRMSQFFSAHHFICKWWANDKSIFHTCAYIRK